MSDPAPVLSAENLSFAYQAGGSAVEVLKGLDFRVERGDFACIQGPSGSGKSTLFYILGLLLRPTSGALRLSSRDVARLDGEQLALARNQEIGFVFQQFHLLAKATVLENILLPSRYPTERERDTSDPEIRARALELARQVGLADYLDRLPNQLSGGQQQRVAIARALLNDADLILADEPTGNLDTRNAAQIMDLLTALNARGKTIVLITHDPEIAARCSKVYHLRDGAFTQVTQNTELPRHPARPPRVPLTGWDRSFFRTARAVLPLVRENLMRNKAKSLLTMLGVIIGVAAVLAMITLGQFTRQRILASYEQLGSNKLLIRGYPNWDIKATDKVPVDFKSFNWEKDLLPLKRIFPEIRYLSPSHNSWRNTASSGGRSSGENKVSILGVAPEYQAITSRIPKLGHGINAFHVESRSPVCVIGYQIAQELFRRSQPLGQVVTLSENSRSFPCLVIGVLPPVTSTSNWVEPNLQVLIPHTYFRSVSGNWWESQIHEAVLQIESGADVEATGKKIKAYFEQRYGKSGQFMVDTDSVLVAQMKRFLGLFAVLLAGIAVLSLAVGGIGINNMMLVSVNERIKEFGVRKALGATDRSLRAQVLLESVTLCVAAGIIGILAGFAAYELMILGATRLVASLKFEWVFDPLAASLSLISIVAVGIASGLVPALRAEKLQVIEALRSE